MKVHSNDFKNAIKQFGKEIDSKITYTIDGETTELGVEELNSVTPHYEADILKSVMKQLDIDSNVDIPLGTIINYQFGVKIDGNYEYIDFGNYVVYSSEKQEDLSSYKIVCYDKMLYSMKPYENIGVTYPITIRNYINALCNYLGLTFANNGDNFTNYSREIQTELFLGSEGESLDYTFRDVFDQLAEVTASTICINEVTGALELRYITNTNDTINEEYLKDINVNFGQKYGPVNSIVLSRGAESDNVYLRDETSVAENGLCEIKIKDNQIMNFNDRSDYLPSILGQLNGLEYYLNDYSSFGITYYNVCDRYNVSIDGTTYSCVMFNDEILVTQGLQENVHTRLPEESQTDYTKADKTDRRINQTYLIVDKQNQKIESVITNVTEQNNKISQISQTVDEINSKISDIADITISGESNFATFTLDNINQSEPITIIVRPTVESISYLYPKSSLYPSSNLYLKTRIIRFHNSTSGEDIDYELPDDLLRYDSDTYDEFYLDFDNQTCQITKRCEFDSNGEVVEKATEQVVTYEYPVIELTEGDYTISILGYEYGYLFTRLMAQNIYTTQFATKVEVNSQIRQTTMDLTLQVDQKTSSQELISKINLTPGQILLEGTVTANDNFKILNDGSIVAKNGSFSGNIFLEGGGRVLGGDGLLSVLNFKSDGFESTNGWAAVGFRVKQDIWDYTYEGWAYQSAVVPYYIPENFTITEAYLILQATPVEGLYGSSSTVVGTCKQLKVYNGDSIGNEELYYYLWDGVPKTSGSDTASGTEIVNCFGSATYTPNVSSPGDVVQKISNNIGSYLTTGEEKMLIIRTNMSKPAWSTTSDGLVPANIQKGGVQNTGGVKAHLYVYGYMSL